MSFRTAISGLRAASSELSVIGNNVANANTTGFKASRAQFADVFAATNGTSSSSATGGGVNTARIAQQFTQGNITFTDNGLDLAISGKGFFVLDDNGAQVYSRDGAFGIDRNGFVVNSSGQTVKAYQPDSSGAITGAVDKLRITSTNAAPSATTLVNLGANLDSQEAAPALAFDPAVNASFNSTTATTVYDSLGGSHLMQLYFVKSDDAAATWDIYARLDGAPSTFAAPNASISFDNAGVLNTSETGTPNGQLALAFTGLPSGAADLAVTLDINEMTQFGAPFGVNRVTQDGFTTGRLTSLDIDALGNVMAHYSNGQTKIQGQVALANFANEQGLRSVGGNSWTETPESGAVVLGNPASGDLGSLQSGALEDSNIDLSEQLVKLIVAQRNFQANTQVIQTEEATNQAIINIR